MTTTARRIDPHVLRDNAAVLTVEAPPPVTSAPAARKLPIAAIRLDGGTQPRAEISQEHISDLADDLRAGAILPPVDVMYDGGVYWLFDGYHRLHAHKLVHGASASIDVRVHQGCLADAQWASFAVNKSHGLRRTTEDKQRAIIAALKHPNGASRSNRELARHLGVDHVTVGNWRSKLELTGEIHQSTERTGADGRTIDTTNIGAAQRRETYASGLPKLDMPLRMAGANEHLTPDANVVPSDAAHTRQQGAPLGKCRVCNRPLYDPAQAAQGIGACCAAKAAAGASTDLTIDGDRPLPEWVTEEAEPVDESLTASDLRVLQPAPEGDDDIHQFNRRALMLDQWRINIGYMINGMESWGALTGRYTATSEAKRGLQRMLEITVRELASMRGEALAEAAVEDGA